VRIALVLVAACSSSPGTEPGWMAKLSDGTSLARLSLPGTHDSGAIYESIPNTAKTQHLDIQQQLDIGVRYLDIRLRNVSDSLDIYHGAESEMQTFDEALATIYAYLDKHPSETVVMSVKEDYLEMNATMSFEDVFASYAVVSVKHWYTDPAVPSLGVARGKIVLVRRYTALRPIGIDASGWQDNTTFTLTTPDATLHVEDAYTVASTDKKWQAITTSLAAASAAAPTDDTLFLTYTSGYMTTAAIPNIPSVSDVIDPMLQTYLEDPANAGAHLGVIAMDFVDAVHANDIIADN
jgi:1-phosphatidylinositol phosphodiesterase